VSDRNGAHELSKREFAELFGISEKQIERFCQAGMPHRKKGRLVFIVMPQGRVWYHEHLVTKGEDRVRPTKRSESADRRAAAEAELAEIALAKARSELMPVADFERIVGGSYARVRARLINLPRRIAGAVLGAQTLQEAEARAEPIVREAMEELRNDE
jgi:ADP-ribose pyrophosphatase YjhB (NUDIX family)